jgi:dihydrofolate reductase
MRQLIAITQVTLDGVMQAPGGPEEDPANGFAHGGWAMRGPPDALLRQVLAETIARDFDLLLGRRTYQIWAPYWPQHGDNPIGKAFNAAPKHVATRSLDRLDWANARPLRGDAADAVRKLKAADGPPLQVWGSSNLLQTLIGADLIDEYRLWVFPLVLGAGKRLFETGVPPRALALVASQATPTGLLLNTYRPTGPLPA